MSETSSSNSQNKIQLSLSSQAEKYVRRDAPVEMRRMAARGALPLAPIELATVLFALVHDPDAEVKETARRSLAELPDNLMDTVLSGPAHPALLSYLADAFKNTERRCQLIALNAAADDATIARLAGLHHKAVVEIISNNQERMLRCDDIVEALGSNPLTSRATIDRILTFLGGPVARQEHDDRDADAAVSEEQAEAALIALLGQDMSDVARQLASEQSDGDFDDDQSNSNLFAVIQKMTIMQKIKLARLGGKEARGLLIRDRNKIVATSVIASPKISEQEVIGIAQSRNVCDEVLRRISANRDWTRNYQIKRALATNPKVAQQIAIKFLNYLQEKDLRGVMKSKEVSTAISTHARRILQKKGKL